MKNSKEKLAKKNKGITLVALVVTVIVLLILVGVTINLVLNDEGIFKNAKSAGEKTKVEKAREMLEIVLMDAQIMKRSSEGLTDEQLTNKIKTVGEERRRNTSSSRRLYF